jgi:PAS domain S-box-containing protein
MARKPATAIARHKVADPTIRLKAKIQALQVRLHEAESTLEAIRLGHVDALIVQGPDGEQVFTLEGADHRYRVLVETMNEGALLLDRSGTIVYANARFAALMKTPLEKLIGKQIRDSMPGTWHPMLEAMLTGPGGASAKAEIELVASDRVRIPVYLSATASWDAEDRLIYVIATDLSEQKRSQEAVGAERLATLIVEQAAEGIVVCDTSGKVIRASKAAHRAAGENPLLRPFVEVFRLRTTEDADAGATIVRSALSGETTNGLEVTLRRADGAVISLLLSAGPILAGDGASLGCVLSFVDNTDQRRASEERLRLLQGADIARIEAVTANVAKDEFLAMLGHELRNPLAPILTALELMRLRAGNAFLREREIIERQVKHVVILVEDLLDVSRITQGKVKLERSPIEIAKIAKQAVELASPLIEERGHTLTVEVPGDLTVDVDENRMCQVIANLLTNAAKYTQRGGRIRLWGAQDGEEIVLTVHDNGIGIDPSLLPNVFETFVQGQRTSERSEGGLGLGLAIVRSLVTLHGGVVTARSAGLGSGSEFELRLPRSLLATPSAPPATSKLIVPTVGRKRVLIVDDNQDAADLLAEMLGGLGHVTRVAYDGPAALKVATTFAFDVGFLDIGLPGMDGYELAGRLRGETEGARQWLVALTGYGQGSDRQRSTEAGFDEHLVKPIALRTIVSVLDRPT